MLFGYPLAATLNNWVHDCFVESVRNIHTLANARKRYPEWPDILPENLRLKLKLRTGLRDRLKTYNSVIRKLSKEERSLVLKALEDATYIAEILDGSRDCAAVGDMPESIRASIDSLFSFGFSLLTEFGVRDEHYAIIYAAADPDYICPFCGTEYFDAPSAPREDLDHYLAISRYPFAGVNLRNLVPMGHKCNSTYKHSRDVIRDANGVRRTALDPYNHETISLVLDDSDPFNGSTENTPAWNIEFTPSLPGIPAWDDVFRIRERYRRDHLDPNFSAWLKNFGSWVRISNVLVDTDQALVDALKEYESIWSDSGIQDRAFLKSAVFRMLRKHCEAGHQRLISQLRDLVQPIKIHVGV